MTYSEMSEALGHACTLHTRLTVAAYSLIYRHNETAENNEIAARGTLIELAEAMGYTIQRKETEDAS